MARGLAAPAGFTLGAFVGSNIGFVPDDRINALGLALAVKFDCSRQVAVVRQGNSVHAKILDVIDQLRDAVCPVKQAVVAMAMEMNERPFWHRSSFLVIAGYSSTEHKEASRARQAWNGWQI